MYKAMLGKKAVVVAMLRSDKSLTVYPFVSDDDIDMTVLCNVPIQAYKIGGIITLETDFRSNDNLTIRKIELDNATRGKW